MRRSERSSSARRCMLRHPWCPWNQRAGASLVHVHVRACVWNPKGSTYLYQGYTKLSRTNSNTCRGARKPLISIQTRIEKRIVAWSGWRLPRRQKRPPSNEPSGPTTAGGSQAAESAFKQEHTWLLPRPPPPPLNWWGFGGDRPQHQPIGFSWRSAWWAVESFSGFTYRWRLHLIFPQTAQLLPRGNSSRSCRCRRRRSQDEPPEDSTHLRKTLLLCSLVWWWRRCSGEASQARRSSRTWPRRPGTTRTPSGRGGSCVMDEGVTIEEEQNSRLRPSAVMTFQPSFRSQIVLHTSKRTRINGVMRSRQERIRSPF